MIEYLALAAEVTAVLLIISIGFPGRRRPPMPTDETLVGDHASITDLEPFQDPLRIVKLLVHQAASKIYAEQSSASVWLQSDSHREITQSLQQFMTLATLPDQDALTHLPAIETLKAFFSNLRSFHRRLGFPMQIASLVVDRWSELIHHEGPVVADRVLRELASVLSDKLSPHGCTIRFSEYTFTVGLVGLTTPQAVELLDCIRQSIEDNKILVGEHEISTSVSIALTKISDSDFNAEDHIAENVWERLEESVAQAITAGGNQIQGYSTTEAEENLPVESQPVTVETKAITTENDVSPEKIISTPTETISASTSAVSGDDITALFAAQKKPTTQSVPSTAIATETAVEKPNKTESTAVAVDTSASADDIASLFAAMKKPAPKQQPDAPTAVSVAAPAAAPEPPPVVSDDATAESLVATLEDIQSLFADAQIKHAAKQTEKSTAKPDAFQSKMSEPFAEPEAAKITAVDADDIEALFATMRK